MTKNPVSNFNITIVPESEELLLLSETIAKKFGGKVSHNIEINTSANHSENMGITIFVGAAGISIKMSGNINENPVHIDFSSNKMLYRQENSGTRKESIARAVGLKSGQSLTVLDATAGLGGDSFILASLGANITMLERNPFIHLLLEDALSRASGNPNLEKIIARMNLVKSDSINFIENMATNPDVIYMDPMFPDKTKTALAKKEMRLFKIIAGKDEDADILFTKALSAAGKRVVVKRPAKAPYITDKKPEFSTAGKSSRFDVYITSV